MDSKQKLHIREKYSFTSKEHHWSESLGSESIILLLALFLVIALWVGSGVLTTQSRDQGAENVKEAILESSMQCFAIEGAYPQSLNYLKQNYGLSINEAAYFVTYETFASNVLPSVTVRPR